MKADIVEITGIMAQLPGSKYLPLYIAEFQFRYNNRENENIFGEAIRGC